MERNYLLVYIRKFDGSILHNYFATKEDMNYFIRVNLSARMHWKVLHKYEIKEIK